MIARLIIGVVIVAVSLVAAYFKTIETPIQKFILCVKHDTLKVDSLPLLKRLHIKSIHIRKRK